MSKKQVKLIIDDIVNLDENKPRELTAICRVIYDKDDDIDVILETIRASFKDKSEGNDAR